MQFTPSTIPLLILTAILLLRAKGEWLPVALFLSVFEAASFINLTGGMLAGIAPGYLALICACFQLCSKRRNGDTHSTRRYLTPALLLTAFCLYAFLSALVFPEVFAGVTVKGGRSIHPHPLAPSFSNLAQSCYLLLCLATYLTVFFRARTTLIRKSLNWYVAGGVFSSVVCIYQWAAAALGLPFPSDILFSNPSRAIFEAYDLGGMTRVNGTFSEASFAALHLGTALGIAAWSLTSHRFRIKDAVTAAVILLALFLTFSSTSYLCLLLICAVVLPHLLNLARGNKEMALVKAATLFACCAFLIGLAFNDQTRETARRIFDVVLMQKSHSTSFAERSEGNQAGLDAAMETNLLGTGWGSCRAYSLLAQIPATVGLPGSVLFLAFFILLIRPVFAPKRCCPAFKQAAFALATCFCALIVSVPDIGYPVIWVLLAAVNVFHPRNLPTFVLIQAPAVAITGELGMQAAAG